MWQGQMTYFFYIKDDKHNIVVILLTWQIEMFAKNFNNPVPVVFKNRQLIVEDHKSEIKYLE